FSAGRSEPQGEPDGRRNSVTNTSARRPAATMITCSWSRFAILTAMTMNRQQVEELQRDNYVIRNLTEIQQKAQHVADWLENPGDDLGRDGLGVMQMEIDDALGMFLADAMRKEN